MQGKQYSGARVRAARGVAFARQAGRSLRALALALGLGTAMAAQAAYPERPIQIVISFPPAGAADVMARAVGQKLSEELKQSVVVENRPGGGGGIGMTVAARAQPDGYTVYLAAVTNLAIAASIYKSQQSNLAADFVPIGGVGIAPHVLVVPATLPVNNVAELIAYIKKSPGQYNFASQGTGTLSHLESALFTMKAGLDMVHVPYKGSSQALPDVISGRSSMFFDSIPGSMALVKSGKLKALAVGSSRRAALLPDVPTLGEAGLSGIEADNLFGLVAPKGTPQQAIDTITSALEKVLALPDLKSALAAQGAELRFMPAAALGAAIVQETQSWGEVVRAAKVEPQ